VGTGEDLLEGADGVLEGHELALEASEDLSDLERLGHETLNLASTLDLDDVVSVQWGKHD